MTTLLGFPYRLTIPECLDLLSADPLQWHVWNADTFFDTEAAMLLPDEIHPVDLEHARLRTLAYAIEQRDLPPTLEVTSGEVPDHLLPIFRYELAQLCAARNNREIKTVVIPSKSEHEGHACNTLQVHLHWNCPQCGARRGEPSKTISYDGSRRLGVDGWKNPCGHVDLYADVRREARANGLNEVQS